MPDRRRRLAILQKPSLPSGLQLVARLETTLLVRKRAIPAYGIAYVFVHVPCRLLHNWFGAEQSWPLINFATQ